MAKRGPAGTGQHPGRSDDRRHRAILNTDANSNRDTFTQSYSDAYAYTYSDVYTKSDGDSNGYPVGS